MISSVFFTASTPASAILVSSSIKVDLDWATPWARPAGICCPVSVHPASDRIFRAASVISAILASVSRLIRPTFSENSCRREAS